MCDFICLQTHSYETELLIPVNALCQNISKYKRNISKRPKYSFLIKFRALQLHKYILIFTSITVMDR